MPRNARVSRQQQAFEALLDEDFQDGEPGTARSTTTGQRRNGKGASRRERADGGFRLRCDAEQQRQTDEHKADLEHLLELYGDRYEPSAVSYNRRLHNTAASDKFTGCCAAILKSIIMLLLLGVGLR